MEGRAGQRGVAGSASESAPLDFVRDAVVATFRRENCESTKRCLIE